MVEFMLSRQINISNMEIDSRIDGNKKWYEIIKKRIFFTVFFPSVFEFLYFKQYQQQQEKKRRIN